MRLSSVSLCRRSHSRRGWLCSLTRIGPVVNTTGVSFRTLSSCSPLKAFSHFSPNADVSSFMTLDQCSRLKSFIPSFEVARPNHLIDMLSCHRPHSLIARRYFISIQFLIVQGQLSLKLFGTLELHFVQTFQDILKRWLTHLFLIEFGPILYRNLERRPSASKYWTGLTGLELHHKLQLLESYHGSCRQFVFLSRIDYVFELAALHTNSLFERGIEDYSSQRRRNHRINHLKVNKISSPFNWLRCLEIVYWFCHLHFVDPWHCKLREQCTHTHFGLEVNSPTLKVTWVWEFPEMQLRDSNVPRRFHHTILGISSSSMIQRIPSLIIPGQSRIRYCWTLRFSSQSFSMSHGISGFTWSQFVKRWCQILWGWRTTEMAVLEQVDLRTRILRYPPSFVYCAANQNRG